MGGPEQYDLLFSKILNESDWTNSFPSLIFKLMMITRMQHMQAPQWEVRAKGREEVISVIDWTPCLWAPLSNIIILCITFIMIIIFPTITSQIFGPEFLLFFSHSEESKPHLNLAHGWGFFSQWSLMISRNGQFGFRTKLPGLEKFMNRVFLNSGKS